MSTLITTTCPSWCNTHTVVDGITLHERHVKSERWDFILTHGDDGTTVDIEVPGDRGLTPSEALALGVALIEAAATIGQAEAEQAASPGADERAHWDRIVAMRERATGLRGAVAKFSEQRALDEGHGGQDGQR